MSTVEMLGIQGIRSFGPDTPDFQKIKFFKPLTLILGPNGTGKTTIIECLKYATTGDMPPGSKGAGAAFVHDPKLANEREIKGRIKLMICDVTGAQCLAERFVTARVKDGKGKKVEMKTLDGVLTRHSPGGEKQSITSRCADLNREMIGALGVSKAVLENVIFCHQEDSNWPLSEGKVLKDKFDAIFASTRYTKVLDELKKLKQSQDQEIREGKKELEYLRQHKQKAEQLQGDLEELETKLAASEDSVGKINEDLKPIRDELENINVRYNEIYKLQGTRDKHKNEKEMKEESIKDLSKKIKEDFQGSTAELKRELREFTSQIEAKQNELQEHEEKQDTLAVEMEELNQEKGLLLMEVGKLQNEAETHEDNIKKRDEKICRLAQLYGFEGFEESTQIDDEKYRTFFQLMKERLTSMMDDAKKKKAEFEESEKQLQSKIDGLKENKTRLEQSEKMKNETIAKNTVEIRELNQKLGQMQTSAGRLTGLTTELKRAENDLRTTEASVNVDDVKREMSDFDRQKRQLDVEINELNSEMNRLHKHSKVQTELDMLVANQQEKEATIDRLRTEHEDSIVSLLGHTPIDNLRESVSTYISNQTENVKRCSTDLNNLRTQISTKQTEKNSTATYLKEKEEELRVAEEKIYGVCESQDLDEEFSEVQRNLTQAQEEKGSLLGADHMIKKYIRGLEKNNPNCPLCSRSFQQAQEVRELILKLQEQLRKVPVNMKKAEDEMVKYQKKYDEIMQLRPVKENITALREKDIPNLKTKLKKLDEDIKKLKDEVQKKEEEWEIQDADLQTAKHIQPDVVDMDRRRGEVRELERKIEAQRALLSGDGGLNRSMEDVIREKEEKQLELDTVNRNLDHRRDKLSSFQEQTQKLRSKVHTLQEEKLAIEGELQQKTKLEERKATLNSENKNNQRDIEDARSQLRPLETNIQKLVKEKEQVTLQKEEMMESARADVDDVKNKGNGVKNLNTEIRNYIQSGKSEKLRESQERQSQLAATQARKEEQLEEVNVAVKKLSSEISNQQIRERELQDILQLRNMQEEIKTLEGKIADLNEQLGGLNLKNLERERQKLCQNEEDLIQKLHNATGRQQGFKDQIKSTRRELTSDMYKDAHKKYSSKIIEIKTTEIVTGDLNKYYGAMDKAIMMYHKSKMEEINIIIRELWKNTYTGNDIETIEIQSEADDTAAAATTIKSRRNYNYRVVMIKNGVPVDMRGRCSAGQKVLASLIIRLALAETFCVNCGVLALDEPTTNLDRKNIESLAFALVQIIKERSTQRHFQLVVITHDEDFVELLGRADFVDEYVQVSKNQEGLSRLTNKKVEDLHA